MKVVRIRSLNYPLMNFSVGLNFKPSLVRIAPGDVCRALVTLSPQLANHIIGGPHKQQRWGVITVSGPSATQRPPFLDYCHPVLSQSIVIGPGGSTIQTITEEARTDIEAVLQCPVDLTLNVRTKKK